VTIRLRDIADIRSGFPFRSRVENDPAGKLAVIHMRDIQPGLPLVQENLMHIDSTKMSNVERYLLSPGDVVFQSRGHNNRAAALTQPIYGIVALGLYHIRGDQERVMGEYLAWYLNHERTQRRIASMAQGTQIPFIPRTELEMLQIPLPSLELQHKIAELHILRERKRKLQAELDDLTEQLLAAVTWDIATGQQ
jgi:restriction endonuclease S subunit